MDKHALDIDKNIVGRYALGGALTGASAAALLNLVKMIRQMQKSRSSALEPTQTDEGTIVLTLPPGKTAEVVGPETKIKNVVGTKRSTHTGPKRTSQHSRPDGTFGFKTKAAVAGWPTLTASALAAIGGAGTGAYVVNEVVRRRRQKQLEDELEAAKQEYLDMLQASSVGKTAEVLDNLFGVYTKKTADSERTFGMLNIPVAAAALMTILGGGGVAYITKKILDEKLRESRQRGLDIPKVRRIVFQTAPGAPGAKKASVEDLACAQASLCVMLDAMDSKTRILEHPDVKSAMHKIKTSAGTLIKKAQDIDELMAYFKDNPQVRSMITRAAMETHPFLKHLRFATRVPGLSNLADSMFYKKLRGAFPKAAEEMDKVGIGAGALIAGDILGDVIGTKAMSGSVAKDVIAEMNKQREQRENEQTVLAPENIQDVIDLKAKDPNAQAYLDANKARILQMLQRMHQQGLLEAKAAQDMPYGPKVDRVKAVGGRIGGAVGALAGIKPGLLAAVLLRVLLNAKRPGMGTAIAGAGGGALAGGLLGRGIGRAVVPAKRET